MIYNYADKYLQSILEKSRNIAVVGMSRDKNKTAHQIPAYLKSRAYKVIPINPFAERIIGLRVYPNIAAVDARIDLLNVFRPSEQVLDVVLQAVERRKSRGDIDAIWLQSGIRDDAAGNLAETEGIRFVQDRCIYADYNRLM